MKPARFVIELGNEKLTSHTGLALVGALMERTRLSKRLDCIGLRRSMEPDVAHSDVVKAMIGLLCLAKPDFDAVEPFREDDYFSLSLGLKRCPSSPTLRQRLNRGAGIFDGVVESEAVRLVAEWAPGLTGVATPAGERIPLDIDVSPFDNSYTKKEGVGRTYKGVDGYAPIFAYLGVEGYLMGAELRQGKQHSQNGTPVFLSQVLSRAGTVTAKPLLVRMDSGFDSGENLGICISRGVDFVIKRNLRKESLEEWYELAESAGPGEEMRPGKRVYRGSVDRKMSVEIERDGRRETETRTVRLVYEVVERTIVKGQRLLLPDVEVATYWTSLAGSEADIIALYQAHGTSEQYHSELKTDMDLERLPSGKLAVNALVLRLGMFAYNVLRLCGQDSLRESDGHLTPRPHWRRRGVQRRRIRTVIQDLMYQAGRLITHARRWKVSLGRCSPWAAIWCRLFERYTSAPMRI